MLKARIYESIVKLYISGLITLYTKSAELLSPSGIPGAACVVSCAQIQKLRVFNDKICRVQSPIFLWCSVSLQNSTLRLYKILAESNLMHNAYDFQITTMGIRILVTLIIVQLCILNSRQISAWSVVALMSRLSSGPGESPAIKETAREVRSVGAAYNLKGMLYKESSNWTELVLTIQWPQSFCLEYNDDKGNGLCKVPAGVNDWTIHGLWPSNPGALGPEFCNKTWTFDVTEIADLEFAMNASWPNMLTDEAYDSLWSHEWDKHGTCASSLPALYGEHNYFLKTLTLKKQYDVQGMLEASSIIPSQNKSYDYTTIFNAIKSVIGTDPILTCLYDQKTKRVYLSQVEFCLDKQFKLIDCVAPNSRRKANLRKANLRDENCNHDTQIFYPPLMNGKARFHPFP